MKPHSPPQKKRSTVWKWIHSESLCLSSQLAVPMSWVLFPSPSRAASKKWKNEGSLLPHYLVTQLLGRLGVACMQIESRRTECVLGLITISLSASSHSRRIHQRNSKFSCQTKKQPQVSEHLAEGKGQHVPCAGLSAASPLPGQGAPDSPGRGQERTQRPPGVFSCSPF